MIIEGYKILLKIFKTGNAGVWNNNIFYFNFTASSAISGQTLQFNYLEGNFDLS
jgi:hypothetical protein